MRAAGASHGPSTNQVSVRQGLTREAGTMTEQVAQAIEKSAHTVEKSAHVIGGAVEVARMEGVDWRTLREALALAGTAALRFFQWWLCGRGLHAWQAYEYEDGTPLEECCVCGVQREPEDLEPSP